MQTLNLPSNQIFHHVLTGKFKAPSADWKHEHFYLAEYELFVITEGTLYLNYNNENFTVKQGEYLLLHPCDAWREGFKSAYSSFYWLHFTVDDICANPNNCIQIPQTGVIPRPEKLAVLMKQLQDEVKHKYPAIALDSMTTSIITELYGQLSLDAPLNIKSAAQKQIYLDIMDYIERNIRGNLKIADIADHFGYNEKYLSHLFADIAGIPLKQFIITRKMDAANFMLSDSNTSITEIASVLGFSDSHNFSRAYKNFTGLTPSEYRNAFAGRMLYFE